MALLFSILREPIQSKGLDTGSLAKCISTFQSLLMIAD